MRISQGVYSIVGVVAISLLGMQAALADVTAVYEMTSSDGSTTQSIRYVDKQHVRVDTIDVNKRQTTIMKLGDKVYLISGEVVQDMDQLAGMMAMIGKGAKASRAEHVAVKYEDTGRTETIAGITGKVYQFEDRGKKHEIVLAQDKDLQAAVVSLVEMTKASVGVMSDDPMNRAQQDASIQGMALLRLDDAWRLQSINDDPIADSVFVLPAKPQHF